MRFRMLSVSEQEERSLFQSGGIRRRCRSLFDDVLERAPAWIKRLQRGHKFCLLVDMFGIIMLQAVPAESVTKLEKITIGKLVRMRRGCLEPRQGGDLPYQAIN